MSQRTDFIERSALEVLRKANALSVPVDLSKVAESLGVKLHYETIEDKVSGVLIVKGAEKHVMVNAAHPTRRQRFSIGHEIGHLVLHADKDRLFIDTHLQVYRRVGAPTDVDYEEPGSTTTPEEEREANLYAAALLMPGALLEHAALGRDLFDEIDVDALADAFNVSGQAMSIRLQQLGVVQLAFEPGEAPGRKVYGQVGG